MTANVDRRTPSPPIDRLGLVASTACALHCAATALVPTALTVLGASALLDHEAEWVFTFVAVGVASLALVLRWRKRGISGATLGLAVGIAGLLAARLLEDMGGHGHGFTVGLSVLSGGALVTGHLLNLRPIPSPAAVQGSETCCVPE